VSFSIESCHPDYLEGLTTLYNSETAFEPHIAPLDPARFVMLVETKPAFDPESLFVAVDAGEVVGWVHACVSAGTEVTHDPRQKVARISMLIFPRRRLPVGQALVNAATSWLRRSGPREAEALSASAGYPFYRGLWLGGEPMGPATMPHVQLALDLAGYKNTQESVFMVAEMTSAPHETPAAVPFEWAEGPLEMTHEPMRESWIGFQPMRTRALIAGEEVGSIGWVLQPHLAGRLGAPCLNIWSLGVREPHRRKGIATALLARVMARGHALGARFASLSTQLWNAPAHAAYVRAGFSPHCLLIGRTLVLHGGAERQEEVTSGH
jgi:GNAT superfamily N-acetyltransferase